MRNISIHQISNSIEGALLNQIESARHHFQFKIIYYSFQQFKELLRTFYDVYLSSKRRKEERTFKHPLHLSTYSGTREIPNKHFCELYSPHLNFKKNSSYFSCKNLEVDSAYHIFLDEKRSF